MTADNERRARNGGLTIAHYRGLMESNYSDERTQEVLGDLLADLRHYCYTQDVDFDRAIRISFTHFEAECDEDPRDREAGR